MAIIKQVNHLAVPHVRECICMLRRVEANERRDAICDCCEGKETCTRVGLGEMKAFRARTRNRNKTKQ